MFEFCTAFARLMVKCIHPKFKKNEAFERYCEKTRVFAICRVRSSATFRVRAVITTSIHLRLCFSLWLIIPHFSGKCKWYLKKAKKCLDIAWFLNFHTYLYWPCCLSYLACDICSQFFLLCPIWPPIWSDFFRYFAIKCYKYYGNSKYYWQSAIFMIEYVYSKWMF